MFKALFSPANYLPLVIFATLLVGNLLFALVLYQQLVSIADSNQAKVGKSLAYQLAYSVKAPMLHQDTLSLQVGVTEIAQQSGVARAAIYDDREQLIVEKQNRVVSEGSLTQYRAAIEIENAVAGYAVIDASQHFYRRQSLDLFRVVLLLSVLTSGVAVAVAWRFNRHSTERLRAITNNLPMVENDQIVDHQDDEFLRLEQRIAPLLTARGQSQQAVNEPPKNCTLVSLKCISFNELREQLSDDHFFELLLELDNLLEKILKLYDGKLLSFIDNTLVMQFEGSSEDDDCPVRALYTCFALLKQLDKLQSNSGVAMAFSAALISQSVKESDFSLQEMLAVEERYRALGNLSQRAEKGAVLLDKTTAGHQALDDIALLEPVSSSMDVFRCEGLQPTADTLVIRQLALLEAIKSKGVEAY